VDIEVGDYLPDAMPAEFGLARRKLHPP